MTASVIMPSFAAGEVSPSFWGHTSHQKFGTGCSTLRNMFVSIRGGAMSRAGTLFCGIARQPAFPGSTDPRLIPFQFRTNQGYILEFGDHYVRFIANGGYITETPFAITGATQANPLVLSAPGHNFNNGDFIFIAGVAGMTQLDGVTFVAGSVVAGASLTLNDPLTGVPVNSLAFPAYTGGGTAARIYTLTTPYAASDLPYLKYTQSADLMSLTLSNPAANTEYPPQDLTRFAAANWTIAPTFFGATITAPSTCTAAPSTTIGTLASANQNNAPAAQYAYAVTAVDIHGNESQASPVGYTPANLAAAGGTNNNNSVDISITAGSVTVTWAPVSGAVSYNVYKATPAVWNTGSANTAAPQNVPIGSAFGFAGSVVGTQWVDQNVVADFATTPPLHQNPFAPGQILNVTSTGGGASYVQSTTHCSVSSATGSGAVILPVVVAGAVVAFIVQNAGQGYRAIDTLTITGAGSGASGALTVGPQSGTYPGVVTYFQGRRGFANTLNSPDTYFFSQTGNYTNMDAADPPIPSDAIIGTPWAQQINGIQWMVPMTSGLVVGTGLDAWLLTGSGGGGTPVEPASQNAAAQETNGFSPTVAPIKVNYEYLFPQALGARIRAAVFNFWNNTYNSEDLTILSNHLFDGHKIVAWAWAQEPYKLIWIVRDDGVLLSLTYLKEQQVIGWARHDTQGQAVSIAAASEPPVDAVYVAVKRFVPGKNAYGYFVERMDNRLWTAGAESCWCVDAALSLMPAEPAATLTASAASGNGVTFTASASVFDGVKTGVAGQVIRIGGGKATVTGYVSPTQVTGTITVPITALTPDIPGNLTQIPLPAMAGNWSIGTSVTSVSGLNHLEGMTVTGLADGAVIPPTVVTNGAIALPNPASLVVVGLPFQAQVQSLHLQQPGQEIQDERKRVIGVTVRLEQSRGVKLGANQPNASAQENTANAPWGVYPFGRMIEVPETQNLIGPAQYLPLFTGDRYIPIDDDWNMPGQSAPPGMIAAQQDYPLPLNVLAFIPKFATGDTPVP
jgi:hypothetical protein